MQRVALAMVVREGQVLLARRPADGLLPEVWEFPGGKVETDEDPAAAALRELREETGLEGGSTEKLAVLEHDYGHGKLQLWAYLITGATGRPVHHTGAMLRRAAPGELKAAEMPAANRFLLPALLRRLGESEAQ